MVLRVMENEEFPGYCEYFIDDYSREIVQNYGHSIDFAIELAKKDLDDCFPRGLKSENQSLLCLETLIGGQSTVVGYLWHSVKREEKSTFIYDFYVSDEYRGKGFGKQAISLLENKMISIGINQIKLRVAYHNERTLKLYKDVGFSITGFNMSKKLKED